MKDPQKKAKEAAALAAMEFVKPGMRVGLGSGTTAAFFIEALGKSGIPVEVVATSKASADLADQLGLLRMDLDQVSQIDLVVDGADEVDPKMQLIKGAGGALLREKIVAKMAKQVVLVVDESKCVEQLGAASLPVEILPFCHQATLSHIQNLGIQGELRLRDGKIYLTNNQNTIVDLMVKGKDLSKIDLLLHQIPGVIETGYFHNLATHVIIGSSDGSTKIRP